MPAPIEDYENFDTLIGSSVEKRHEALGPLLTKLCAFVCLEAPQEPQSLRAPLLIAGVHLLRGPRRILTLTDPHETRCLATRVDLLGAHGGTGGVVLLDLRARAYPITVPSAWNTHLLKF